MIPPLESVQYLVDVFIEGGYAEDEDLDHLDAIHMWLRSEEKARDAAFKRRVTRDVVNNLAGGWVTDPRNWEDPATMPVNRNGEDEPVDDEVITENRSTYTIVDLEGNKYYFKP